jgi:putative addiction module component (TIGR02574 family)
MASTLLEIEEQAAQLPPGDRAKLAEFLLESLQENISYEVEREWKNEIETRLASYEKGETLSYSATEVFAEAKRLS